MIAEKVVIQKHFVRELDNFNEGYIIKDIVDEDLILVQIHSGAEIGKGRSLKFWTTAEQANKFKTIDDYLDNLALLSEWGDRTYISVARIPKATKVKHAIGTAIKQKSKQVVELRKGNGVQILFEEFNMNWVKATKEIPK